MVQGRLEISARKNPLEVYRKSARVPPADSARKNPLEVSRKSARVAPYTTVVAQINNHITSAEFNVTTVMTHIVYSMAVVDYGCYEVVEVY